VLPAANGGPGPVARALLFLTIVMPHIELIPEPKWGTVMSVQHSPIASSGAWGVAATVAWAALLTSAIVGLIASRGNTRVRLVALGTLAGQVVLHLLYGEETFLYAIHVAPLLVLTTALAASSTPWRRVILVLAAVLVLTAAVNNLSQLETALEFFFRTP